MSPRGIPGGRLLSLRCGGDVGDDGGDPPLPDNLGEEAGFEYSCRLFGHRTSYNQCTLKSYHPGITLPARLLQKVTDHVVNERTKSSIYQTPRRKKEGKKVESMDARGTKGRKAETCRSMCFLWKLGTSGENTRWRRRGAGTEADAIKNESTRWKNRDGSVMLLEREKRRASRTRPTKEGKKKKA